MTLKQRKMVERTVSPETTQRESTCSKSISPKVRAHGVGLREKKTVSCLLLPPAILDAKRDLSLMKWTLYYMFWYTSTYRDKRNVASIACFTARKTMDDSGKTFVVYRTQMLRLLAYPKPTFDQLAIELPCLMGFRAAEVASWRAEYIDFQNMNTKVLDAKKHRLFTLPLNLYIAKDTETILNGRSKGPVLQSRSTRNMGEEISPFAVWHIWDKWTKIACPFYASEISPATGRRFFARLAYSADPDNKEKKTMSLISIQLMMRHKNPRATLWYLEHSWFFEDLKREYDDFQFSVSKSLEDMKRSVLKSLVAMQQTMKPLQTEAKT